MIKQKTMPKANPVIFIGNVVFIILSPVIMPLLIVVAWASERGNGFASTSAWDEIADTFR